MPLRVPSLSALRGAKPSKYKAVRCEVDGITFASKKEARRYASLKLLERAAIVSGLQCQTAFALQSVNLVTGEVTVVGHYRSDFTYWQDGRYVVEDVKSPATKTAVYRLKKRLLESQYGVRILET